MTRKYKAGRRYFTTTLAAMWEVRGMGAGWAGTLPASMALVQVAIRWFVRWPIEIVASRENSRRIAVQAAIVSVTLLCAAYLTAGLGAAAPIAVRTGEHQTFSRLVLTIVPESSWSLEAAPGGYALVMPEGTEFGLSGAFERLPRDRLTRLDVEGGTGRLRLELGCDCHAAAFLHDERHLVIDVIDGPTPPGALLPGPALPKGSALGTQAEAASMVNSTGHMLGADAVAGTQEAILQGFARAASQGLLDLAPSQDIATNAPAGLQEGGAPSDAEAVSALPDHPSRDVVVDLGSMPDLPAKGEAAQPGLSLRTSVDREPRGPPLGEAGAICQSDEAFDLAAWGGTEGFAAAIGRRMTALTTDRDLLTEGAVEALARAYIAFGFGKEAAQALSIDGQRSAERDRLRLLATIVDGDMGTMGALADQGGCLGVVALWRALALGGVEGADERERTAITVAARALPDAVRGHLAVRLAGLFLQAGDPGAAQAILAMADGTATGGDTQADLTRAAVTHAMVGRAPAIDALAVIAARDPRTTPEGLVDLVDLTIEEGRPVNGDLIALVRASRFEHRGTPAATALLLAEIRGLSASSRHAGALALLKAEGAQLSRDDAGRVLAGIVDSLLEAQDGPFLDVALTDLPDALPETLALPVAERLRTLGFAPEAEALLALSADVLEETREQDAVVRQAPDPGADLEPGQGTMPTTEPEPAADVIVGAAPTLLRRPSARPVSVSLIEVAAESGPSLQDTSGSLRDAPDADGVGPTSPEEMVLPMIAALPVLSAPSPSPDLAGLPAMTETTASIPDIASASATAPVDIAAAVFAPPAQTLADRQALLDVAAGARERAMALLDEQLPAQE